MAQAELAAADVPRYTFRGRADSRQFVIVNRPRTIHGDVRDKAALDQVDHKAAGTHFDDVPTHYEDAGGPFLFGGKQPLRHSLQLRMRELGHRPIELQNVIRSEEHTSELQSPMY